MYGCIRITLHEFDFGILIHIEEAHVVVATELLNIKIYGLQDCYCDPSTISDMLGSEEGVTNKNILQYMGIIEQKTMELLQINQYVQMKVS